jgi:hypothetical protein
MSSRKKQWKTLLIGRKEISSFGALSDLRDLGTLFRTQPFLHVLDFHPLSIDEIRGIFRRSFFVTDSFSAKAIAKIDQKKCSNYIKVDKIKKERKSGK